jgi:hypothetical protein
VNLSNTASGDSWNRDTFFLTVEDAPAGVERSDEHTIQVNPNPTRGPLFISSIDVEEATIQVLDESGRTVLSKGMMIGHNVPLDLSPLAKGSYFVHIVRKNGAAIMKHISITR